MARRNPVGRHLRGVMSDRTEFEAAIEELVNEWLFWRIVRADEAENAEAQAA